MLRIESYDPAIPPVGINAKKKKNKKLGTGIQTNTCVFIAALFTIIQRWKTPKWLLTDE